MATYRGCSVGSESQKKLGTSRMLEAASMLESIGSTTETSGNGTLLRTKIDLNAALE